jgi:penicillin-insensitive murein endopeptidase
MPGPTRVAVAAALTILATTYPAAPVAAQENVHEDSALRTRVLSMLPKDAARRNFGAVAAAAGGAPRVIGEYWKGCYAGGVQLPPTGEHWQAMRLYRNRNWGTPRLVEFVKAFARKAALRTGWPGILVGDMSQPRGGPMLTGHSSHQLGIEADIWLRPMPARPVSRDENETLRSTDLVRADGRDVDPKIYTREHLEVLKAAAMEPEVARIFVNAAIKKALCRDAGQDRAWLRKIRPAAGHTYHFHIRLACPKDQPACIDQPPPDDSDGCGKEVESWLPKTPPSPKPPGTGRAITMASMPEECRRIVLLPSEPPAETVAPSEAAKPAAKTGAKPQRASPARKSR